VIRHLDSQCVVSSEECTANLHRVLSRDYPRCEPAPERTDKLAIVGSAPSVLEHLAELRGWPGEIWAINGAYNFLQDHGVVAQGFIGVDPLPGLAEYVQRAQPQTTFYLSGLCDLAVFDRLDGFPVRVWFPEQMSVGYPEGLWLVGGGTTAITRAPFLARMLGFRDITIYGADSSFSDGRYCYQHGTYGEDSIAPINRVMVNGEGPFDTEICLLKQVSQLGVIALYWDGDLKFKCGGLLDAYLRAPVVTDAITDAA
jgi:hypothetical protein